MVMNIMKNKGYLLVLMTAIISGISIFLNSFAVKGFDSSVFTFAKNVAVGILLFTAILLFKERHALKKLSAIQWRQLIVIGLIGGSIPFLLFFRGMQLASGSTSSFMHKTLFIFAAIMAFFILKEKADQKAIIGAVAILLGTYLMIMPNLSFTSGHLLILGAVLLWSFENILSKKALKNISGNIVAWGRMFFGAIFILVYLLITGKTGLIFSMSSSQYAWIGITTVLLLMYVMTYYNGLKYISVTNATAILTLGAPITAILSWIYGIEQISFFEAAGMCAIFFGVIIISWNAMKTAMNLQQGSHT